MHGHVLQTGFQMAWSLCKCLAAISQVAVQSEFVGGRKRCKVEHLTCNTHARKIIAE